MYGFGVVGDGVGRGAGGAGGGGVGEGAESVVSAGPGTVGKGARGVRVWIAAGSRVVVDKVVGGRAAVSLRQRAAKSKSIANIVQRLRCATERKCFAERSLVLR